MNFIRKYKLLPADYYIVLIICVSLTVLAFVLDSPVRILENYIKLNTSRSVLVTDYIALAGIGATLLNAAIQGFLSLVLFLRSKTKPSGLILAAIFITIGFSLFGKNLFNTAPLVLGVLLYSKFKKIKFSEVSATAMFSGTIAPIVSEIAFLNEGLNAVNIIAAYAVGIFIGFIFPIVAESAKHMHQGYCLYNSGIAGGFISTFFVGILRSMSIEVLPEHYWDTSHTLFLAVFVYILGTAFIIFGFFKEKPVNAFKKFIQLINDKDFTNKDYLNTYGSGCYINIGVMCVAMTSVILILNIPINGPVLGGILTVTGFAAAGKNLKNSLPIMFGSILAAHFNHLDLAASGNALSILFSLGLAPVCTKHGWICGIIVGFFHNSVAIFIGNLNGGMNLYNNGFAEGFVAITIVPLIIFVQDFIQKRKESKEIS